MGYVLYTLMQNWMCIMCFGQCTGHVIVIMCNTIPSFSMKRQFREIEPWNVSILGCIGLGFTANPNPLLWFWLSDGQGCNFNLVTSKYYRIRLFRLFPFRALACCLRDFLVSWFCCIYVVASSWTFGVLVCSE
jgi:hypothetical protein